MAIGFGSKVICINDEGTDAELVRGREYIVTTFTDTYLSVEGDDPNSVWDRTRFRETDEVLDDSFSGYTKDEMLRLAAINAAAATVHGNDKYIYAVTSLARDIFRFLKGTE
jgi:hypothetical protein